MATLVWLFFSGFFLLSAAQPKEEKMLQNFHRLGKLRSLGIEFADHFQKIDALDFKFSSDEDLRCLNDVRQLITGLKAGHYWALKMIDAWGSIPTGLFTGNSYDLGNFDECLSIREEISQSVTIGGKYCFISVASTQMEDLNFNTATCLPATCTASHINLFLGKLLNQFLSSSSVSEITINEGTCQTSASEIWDGLTIFTVAMLSLMSFFVVFFTLYDYFLCERQNQLPAMVKAFSARANSRALFRVVENHSNQNVIDCLHGIRCLSLIWVVFCHQYVMALTDPNINLFQAKSWAQKPSSSFIIHGFYSVDSFLFLGGLLVSLLSLRAMDKTNGKLDVPLMYLHRIIRIAPVLAMAVPVYWKFMPILSRGPLFSGGYSESDACESGWYWTVLFLNNIIGNRCLRHSWYLSVDMQLFILSPFLLISLNKWGMKAAAGIILLIVLLSGCLFATMMVNNYSAMLKSISLKAMMKMYFATHTHATPWLIGFLFGYFLHMNKNKKFHLRRVSVWSGWILCLAMIFTSIFAVYPAAQSSAPPLSTLAESFYYTLTRVGWPLALCWVVFACIQGYGGLANSFLSCPLWQPLSRLSFSVYMWHKFIMEINARSVRTSSYFSDYNQILKFWSTFGVTLLCSYIMHLIIEAPFSGLERLIQFHKKSTRIEKQTRIKLSGNT